MRTIEAIIDEDGGIRLLQPVDKGVSRRAIVVLLDDVSCHEDETAALSEQALDDWNRPEEEAAWSHLQPGTANHEPTRAN